MKWLIWKEFRLNWPILAIAALFLVVPYVVAAVKVAMGGSAKDICELLEGGWMTNLLVATVILALLGGQSIACERADRSAEFLTYQPVSRGQIVLSKLVWPGVALAVIFGLNSAVLVSAMAAFQDAGMMSHRDLPALFPYLGITLCCFSIAWGISALQNSPTVAVMSGIAVPFVLIWLIMMIEWSLGFSMGYFYVAVVFSITAGLLSVFSFVGGTWYYLRRAEP